LLSFTAAQPGDLNTVNGLIVDAIGVWPISARLSRLVALPLSCDAVDFQDFEMVLCYKAAAEIGVAVWQPDASIQGDDNNQAALLHGLYVAPGAQGQGIGRALVKEIAQRAKRCQRDTLYVRAERFAVEFFRRLGARQLSSHEGPEAGPQAYPHRFVMTVADAVSA